MRGDWVGRPVRRLAEDRRFVTGRGRYVDDIAPPGLLHAAFARSPHPHARITGVDTGAAGAMPGVVAVLTAEDLGEPASVRPDWLIPGSRVKGRPVLAVDRVRHVGEAVAVVIAERREDAADAVEAVRVGYQPLPFVLDQEQARDDNAPLVHEDLPDNVAARFAMGNGGFDEAQADLRFEFGLRNQRLVPFSLEPRVVLADYDAVRERLTVHSSTQLPHNLRRNLAEGLGFPEHRLRVVSPDVGGGFGAKMHTYPEEFVLAEAAIRLGRPVKWVETRRENLVATTHGRDHAMRVEVAANRDGKIVALRVRGTANVGAYLSSMGTGVPTLNVIMYIAGVYDIPHAEMSVDCVFTNTTPVDAYRGAGRPEASYLIERTVDRVARELGLDPVEVRFRNFLRPEQLPKYQPVGAYLDSGRYADTLRLALDTAGYAELRAGQRAALAEGKLVGIGVSCFTETCGTGMPDGLARVGFDRGGFETAVVRVHPGGQATVLSGSHSHGQGHATTFAQIAADELGLAPDQVEVVQGDTDLVPVGVGTFNSRSVVVGGSAVKVAAARVAARIRAIAAVLLGTSPERIELSGGHCRTGDASVTVRDVARRAWTGQGLPAGQGIGLEETEFYQPSAMSAPYGAHLAVVEVDAESGEVSLRRYFAIDDFGVVINPLLARGQVHGALAQGIGQALFEGAHYGVGGHPAADPPIPRFDLVPRFETSFVETPSPTNPLGAKGVGEAGTIAAPPTVVNAVLDALWPLGVKEIEMPLTPERVLDAIERVAR
ncbi:xanthine dehydrogenase family protein molybdopterin-binding subunit [Amycolatopsis nigrescens]|uniref:xanthine dehydrogenase family protein molybdopterin-binding subunit n=1 Tax=Amycolatopsis nigrescens TaxID=381445 RepID=UPI00036F3D23|nr:xanthine dehydrogenase family protein molybdopterin-binding subunit [Amycolatopsis nigrescens]